MSVSLDQGTTIGRLRLVAATADPNALRMRGGTVLGTLDLQPPAMPEQAILCIRKLHDPLPGGLDLRSPAAPRPAAWEAAMRAAVSGAMQRAVRPALGPVPANAEAVLFADRAELLACAARDALQGTLVSHWWWTHLLGGERSMAAVVREWRRAPAYVPAAAELLVSGGEIAPFVRSIPAGETIRIMESMLRVHGLPVLGFGIVSVLTRSVVATIADRKVLLTPESRAEILTTPPWRTIVPEVAQTALTVEQQTFVAIALVLRRAPALARSERFAEEVMVWVEGERRRDVPAAPEIVRVDPQESSEKAFLASRRGGSGRWVGGSTRPGQPAPFHKGFEEIPLHPANQPQEEGKAPVLSSDRGIPEQSGEDSTCPEPPPAPFLPGRVEPPPDRPDPPLREATKAPEVAWSSADLEANEPPLQPVDVEIAIDSDFAGVFFLLNAGIVLGLYSDFTSPVQCGISLDIWDFLALTGAEIADFEDDPIGPLLAKLANRKEGEQPGVDFIPPGGASLSEWVDATVNLIKDRLSLAGIEDPSRAVRRYGRIRTTPAHLDVYFSLAAHPIEIRLAGLDRDPGWIPAAGRHVAFHFD